MPDILFFNAITDLDAGRVGGKGLSLGKTASAGLPVPPGFVITTDAYRRLIDRGVRSDPEFTRALIDAYQNLGGGPVAVRSSATAEDAADTSFAGQQDTILGVEGADAVIAAVERCWRSLFTERAVAYRAKQGVDAARLAMAVVVQQLVHAEAAGVLFTRDPLDPDGKRMLAEASWGLGEAVVSGRVQPDRFRLDRETGSVQEKHLGLKSIRITKSGEEHVPAVEQQQFCMSDAALVQLVELGRKVEEFYGDPRDVEWAYADGRCFLLQARPITVAGVVERERVRQTVMADLKAMADPRGTVWVRYNLSEVLPEPTPMTWAVVQRLLAADGGFGAMNRDLGAAPDPALGSLSVFDLIAGRPMANLSRLPRMQFARPPFEYPFAAYKADPRKALDPRPALNPLAGAGCFLGVLSLPGTILKLNRLMSTTRKQAETFGERFTKDIAPTFVASAKAAIAQDWSKLDPPALVRAFELWVSKTLVEFARESLKPTVFADLAWSTLFETLKPKLGEERARVAVGELSLGSHPPPDADLAKGVRNLAAGIIDRSVFLEQFGHRGTNEMELAQPRWVEAPEELNRLISGKRPEGAGSVGKDSDWESIANEAKLAGPFREFKVQVERLRTYLGLREAGKHYLLLGYAVIRQVLVELDRRMGLNGGIFFLMTTDLLDLLAGKDMSALIADARKRRQTELSLEVPSVLFSDDLEAIGRPLPEPVGGSKMEGVPLSAGVCEGPALVLTEPTAAPPGEGGYILVCPSTDPAWVPLFVRAKGLVMETGGVLSHGAIVAREFGLPAVAGLPGITQQLKTGQMVRVDGGRGTVIVVENG
jgi:rifampicin phosphotransferase